MSHLIGKGECHSCHIRHVSIFAGLTDDNIDEIRSFHPAVVSFEADEIIYHQHDDARNAYTLREGVVKLTKVLPNGRSQIVRILQGGDLFGFCGFAGESYNQTAVAVTNVEVCRLPLGELMEVKRQNPVIEEAMMQRYIQQVRYAEDMMLELGAKKAGERLASFLIRWCSKRPPGHWNSLPLSRAEMGELLGLTIETVSRFLSDWKRRELIDEQRGQIKVLAIDELRKLVCSSGSC